MTYVEKYMNQFGILNKEQEQIMKGTLQYEACRLADELKILKREVNDILTRKKK